MNSYFAIIGAAAVGILFAFANFAATSLLSAEILAHGTRIASKMMFKLALLGLGTIVCLNLSPTNVAIALASYLLTVLVVAIRTACRTNDGDDTKG